MAENLARLVLAPHPDARMVVWTGEQHAMKVTPEGMPWRHPCMAANLGRLLGEEPFCVGQHVVEAPELAAPQLLDGSHPWAAERGFDAVVLHHRGERPAAPRWLGEDLASLEVEPEAATLVQLLPEDEGRQAVPADQRLTHGAPQRLFVKPGRYVLRGVAADDEELWRRQVAL